MTDYTATSKPPADINQVLRNDPFLRAVYRASSLADLTALVQQFGIADPEHRAAMLGLAKLTWVLLRERKA